MRSGNVAFKAKNVGDQPHEIALATLSGSVTLQQLLQQLATLGPDDPEPAGVEFLAGVGPVEPGKNANLVFTERLPAGRYLMVCFLPDQNDSQETPHVLKGMAVEFSVTAQGSQ